MGTQDIQKPFNLFIGFGGAGGKVLASLAERVNQDFESAQQADMNYAFVLVDTDQGELKEASDRIENSLSSFVNRSDLMVETIAIGGPFKWCFSERVAETYESYRKSQKKKGEPDLLKEAWWMVPKPDGEQEPLALAGVVNANEGASQMPISSHLMTFWNEADIKKVVGDVADAFKVRFGAKAEDKPVNMYFVTSLAGGTGRGCWTAFSFLFRQAFEERKIKASPLGLFLDASIFESLWADQPEKLTRPRLNALTGFSELVMFLRNAYRLNAARDPFGRQAKQSYFLPSISGGKMASPKAASYKDQGGPVDGALVIFRESKAVAKLSHVNKYYDLAGHALFMCLWDPHFRSKIWNNRQGEALYAVGSSSVQVPCAELMAYLESYKKWYLISREVNSSGESAKKLAEAKDSLLANLKPDKLLEACKELAQSNKQFKADLKKLLNDSKKTPKQISTAIKGVSSTVNFFDAAKAWTGSSLSSENRHDDSWIAEVLVGKVMDGFLGMAAGAWPLETCRQALAQLAEEWKKWEAPQLDAVTTAKLEEKVMELSGREGLFGFSGPRFSAEEIEAIAKESDNFTGRQAAVKAAEYVASLKGGVSKRLGEAESFLAELTMALSDKAKKIRATLDEEKSNCFLRLAGAGKGSEVAPEFLVPDARLGVDVRINFNLKPIQSADHEQVLQQALASQWSDIGDGESVLFSKGIKEAKGMVFNALLEEAREEGNYSHRDRVRYELLASFDRALEVLRSDPKFVEEKFSLQRVLEQYTARIPEIYKILKDQPQLKFARNLQSIFGISDPRRPMSVQEAAAGLAAFIASHCYAFAKFRTSDQSAVSDNVRVFVPKIEGWKQDDAEKLFAQSPVAKANDLVAGSGKSGRSVEVSIGANKFAISAFCAEGTKDWLSKESDNLGFASLEYWKDGAQKEELLDLLRAAEAPGIENLAYGHERALNGGIGYIDPRFVNDPAWADLRWRPWPRDDSASAQKQQAEADALCLAYLCLGNLRPSELRGKDELSVSAIVDRLSGLEPKAWVLPVLRKEEEGTGWSWRRKAYKAGKPGEEATPGQCGWKAGKLANLRRMIESFRKIPPDGKALLLAEIEALRVIVGDSGLELKRKELEGLQGSLEKFLVWLLEEEVENYADNPAVKEDLRETLEAAAQACSHLFPPTSP